MKQLLIGLMLLNCSYVSYAEEFSLATIETGKVVLAWDELKKMLEEIETLKQDIKQLKQEQTKIEEPLPVEYSITKSNFVGEVKGMSAQFIANFSIQILKDGWVKIPFFDNDIGIESIKIPEDILNDSIGQTQFIRDTSGYYLFAKGPKSFSIQVTFRVPIQVQGLTYTLTFLPPRSVINYIKLQIPEKGLNLVHKTAHSQLIQQDGITIIEAILSERDSLKLGWKVEKDISISRKTQATLHSLASVDKSDISVFSTINLKHVTTLKQILFRLPINAEVIDVTSLDIEQWSIDKLKDSQVIKITGEPDPHKAIKIDILYRTRLTSLPADVDIPIIKVTGIDRIEGFLGVEVLGNLEVTSKQNEILIPAKNLPKKLWQTASNPLLYGYQFYNNMFKPSINIKSYQEIKTVVATVDRADCVTHRTLDGKSITRLFYFIRNNDRQFLTLTLPKNSRLWQAFLDGKPVKPAKKDTGEILIPMKKSASQGGDLKSFSIEIGYINEVNKLSLKGDIINQLPAIDIPISYLKWSLYLPEYYEYSRFEGLLKQVVQFSDTTTNTIKPQIDIPTQGRHFMFEKHLIADGKPYIRGKYGQFLGNDLFLSLHPSGNMLPQAMPEMKETYKRDTIPQQQVAPNMF